MKTYRLSGVLVAVVFAVLLIFFFIPWIVYPGPNYYSGVIGAALGWVLAAFLVLLVWKELGSPGKISSAGFIHKLKKDFFKPETRLLLGLLECNALRYRRNDEKGSANGAKTIPYFEVDENELGKANLPEDIRQCLSKKKYYSPWDLDDMLLGHLEDIGMLEQRGIIDFQMVYDEFSWYIETAWDDEQIKKYIVDERIKEKGIRPDTAIYYHFQYIATKCREYEGLHPGVCIWWWKIKRRFSGPAIKMNA